jgi:hypothetical protein
VSLWACSLLLRSRFLELAQETRQQLPNPKYGPPIALKDAIMFIYSLSTTAKPPKADSAQRRPLLSTEMSASVPRRRGKTPGITITNQRRAASPYKNKNAPLRVTLRALSSWLTSREICGGTLERSSTPHRGASKTLFFQLLAKSPTFHFLLTRRDPILNFLSLAPTAAKSLSNFSLSAKTIYCITQSTPTWT